MKDGDPLEPTSHVTKLVKDTQVHKEPIVIVDGTELIPRKTEEYMSVNWLEYDGDSELDTCLKKIIKIYGKKMKVTNHWLPVINVKKAIATKIPHINPVFNTWKIIIFPQNHLIP